MLGLWPLCKLASFIITELYRLLKHYLSISAIVSKFEFVYYFNIILYVGMACPMDSLLEVTSERDN